jgi:hypothetical protein
MEDLNSIQKNTTIHIKFEKDSQFLCTEKDDDAYQFVCKGLRHLIHDNTDREITNICIEGHIDDIASYLSFYVSLYNDSHRFKIEMDVPEDFEEPGDNGFARLN